MSSLTTISQFLCGAIFLLTGITLRKARASRLFPLFFWSLAVASYLWGMASLLPHFGFMLEGYIPVPLGGLSYLLALMASFIALFFLTSLLLDLLKPSLKEFATRVFLLWGALMLFLVATHLPYPTWNTSGVLQWNLQTSVAIALGVFVGLFSAADTVMLLILAAEARRTKLKLRGFLLAMGLIIYSFSAVVQHIPISFEYYLFASTLSTIGSSLMFFGVAVNQVKSMPRGEAPSDHVKRGTRAGAIRG